MNNIIQKIKELLGISILPKQEYSKAGIKTGDKVADERGFYLGTWRKDKGLKVKQELIKAGFSVRARGRGPRVGKIGYKPHYSNQSDVSVQFATHLAIYIVDGIIY